MNSPPAHMESTGMRRVNEVLNNLYPDKSGPDDPRRFQGLGVISPRPEVRKTGNAGSVLSTGARMTYKPAIALQLPGPIAAQGKAQANRGRGPI